jgi:endonuclease YncB( thermonuclease family)
MTENGGAPSPMDLPVPVWTDFSGPVVSVLDGDTIEVLHNTRV